LNADEVAKGKWKAVVLIRSVEGVDDADDVTRSFLEEKGKIKMGT
jgi:hypothetical protein